MGRGLNKLTAVAVQRAKTPGYFGDGGGLWLQVSSTLTKSWVFRYTIAGKAREMGLGALHTVSLAEAREKALECRKLRLEGVDPLEARNERRALASAAAARDLTFDEATKALIASIKSEWRNPKHQAQWEATLRDYASPVLGLLRCSTIDTALVLKALEPIWTTVPETAMRLRGRIERVINYADKVAQRERPNPARWRGHMDAMLPKHQRQKRVKHHPALAVADVPAFIQRLRSCEGMGARALEFAILCASRSGEVRGARWTEIDLAAKLWICPAERMKGHREHRVALSDAAIELLEALPRFERTDLVFPSPNLKQLSDMTLLAVVRRLNETDSNRWVDPKDGRAAVPHGIARSSFRDWVAERTAFPGDLAEMALAHTIPSAVERSYRRGDMLAKRYQLMNAWARFLTDPVAEGGKVTPIRRTG